jgi:hypothetical protein
MSDEFDKAINEGRKRREAKEKREAETGEAGELRGKELREKARILLNEVVRPIMKDLSGGSEPYMETLVCEGHRVVDGKDPMVMSPRSLTVLVHITPQVESERLILTVQATLGKGLMGKEIHAESDLFEKAFPIQGLSNEAVSEWLRERVKELGKWAGENA